MRNLFEKLTEADRAEQTDFNMDVDVTLYVEGLEDGEESRVTDKVQLLYSIDIEFRSWGIKDILVVPRGVVEFEVEIVDGDDNLVDTLLVKLDLDNTDIPIIWMSGTGYAPESLEVVINRDGTLTKAELNFYFVDQNK